jgi:hypothetical protein
MLQYFRGTGILSKTQHKTRKLLSTGEVTGLEHENAGLSIVDDCIDAKKHREMSGPC